MENNQEKDINAIKMRRNIAFGTVFFLICVGTIFFKHLEHWSWVNSFYYVVATSATVGYGDITPQTEIGRLCASIYILTIVPIILYSFTTIAEISFKKKIENRTKRKEAKKSERKEK